MDDTERPDDRQGEQRQPERRMTERRKNWNTGARERLAELERRWRERRGRADAES